MAHRGRQNADETLAVALAAGQTVRDAARTAGVAERTAHRRWADPEFRRRVDELRGQMVDRAIGRLAQLAAGKALDVMEACLDRRDPETGELVANRKDVDTVLNNLVNLRNHTELKMAIDDLKAAQAKEGQ